jgi:hypothetical protein
MRSLPRDFGEDFRGVPLGVCFVPHVADFPFRVDPVGHAHNAQEGFPEETLHPARAVSLDGFEVRIGEQREIQIVFLFEFCLPLNGVRAAAEDDGVQLVEFFLGVAKLGRFVGSTGSVGLGKEIQDDVFPAKILQRHFFPVISRQFEVRRSHAFFQRLPHFHRLYF